VKREQTVKGKENPVTLVAMVVVRKSLFHPADHFEATSSYRNNKTGAHPIRLKTTWKQGKGTQDHDFLLFTNAI
jgi:hypothetical protein